MYKMFTNHSLLVILFLSGVSYHTTTATGIPPITFPPVEPTTANPGPGPYCNQTAPNLRLIVAGSKYYYIENALKGNWYGAVEFCSYNNMKLLSIDSEEENTLLWGVLYSLFSNSGNQDFHFWTSGTTQQEDTFVWASNGNPMTYTNWFPGQPDHPFTTEKCIEILYAPERGSIQWTDLDCLSTLGVICEAPCYANVA